MADDASSEVLSKPPALPRGTTASPDAEPSAKSEPSGEPAEQPKSDRRSFRFPRRWLSVPAWMISAILHSVALILLALATFTLQDPNQGSEIIASQEADAAEELEMVEFEAELEELETSAVLTPAQLVDPGAAAFGDVSLASEMVATDIGVGEIADTTIGEIGNLFNDGLGMATSDSGMGAAYFFGVRTVGRRFVFVVDNSNSMNRGKFETACAELLKTVAQLNEKQQFYVIFFSDTAYPLFYPKPAEGMVAATEENKRKLEYWLMTVERCLRTKGREAMQMAFQLRPDAIYILGDGSFTDKTVDMMLALPPQHVTINTLGFGMKGNAKQGMQDIAKKFKGKFTDVAVPPPMIALSRQVKRPANRFQHGVWGIELPAAPR